MAKKEKVLWQGHPVRDEEHRRELDLKAAVYQFHHGMDRSAAEARTRYEDQKERHQKAAAHHLNGMRAAYAVGNHEDAQQHHAMYTLHLKTLGKDPAGAVPAEVTRWMGDRADKPAYTFKGHDDDQFLVQHVRETPPQAGLAKAEGDDPYAGFEADLADNNHPPIEDDAPASPSCPNCGRGLSPVEHLNDYCSGCAKDLKDALAYRNETPFPASDEEHEANMQKLLGSLRGAGTPEAIGGAKQNLLNYLRKLGIEGASVDDAVAAHPSETPQQPPLQVFGDPRAKVKSFLQGGKQASMAPIRGMPTNREPALSAPKYGHLRVVKAEEWPHILATWKNLAKADGGERAQGRVKQFDVRKTWLRHRHTPEEQAFDYSSWLSPEQQQNGYRMFVLSHGPGNPVRVHVVHNQQRAGGANGNVDQGDLEVEGYHLGGGAHHNRGLEAAMLNAMMGHAKSRMGADYLSHGPFTPEASAFIEAVAKPHGFQLGEPEDIDDGEVPADQPPGRLVSGGVKVRSQQPQRVPRSFQPRVPQWWRTAAEEND